MWTTVPRSLSFTNNRAKEIATLQRQPLDHKQSFVPTLSYKQLQITNNALAHQYPSFKHLLCTITTDDGKNAPSFHGLLAIHPKIIKLYQIQ